MKKETTPSKLFGLKQREMAMLLGVSLGQYSMFESGRRNLPQHASALLNEMLLHHHESANAKTSIKTNDQAIENELQKMLRENQYQQLALKKKLASAVKKRDAQKRQLGISNFFDSQSKRQAAKISAAPEFLAMRGEQALRGSQEIAVMKLELKLLTLEFEQREIEGRLGNGKIKV